MNRHLLLKGNIPNQVIVQDKGVKLNPFFCCLSHPGRIGNIFRINQNGITGGVGNQEDEMAGMGVRIAKKGLQNIGLGTLFRRGTVGTNDPIGRAS